MLNLKQILTCLGLLFALALRAQTTVVLPDIADAVIGINAGFSTANNNYGSAAHFAATSQPNPSHTGYNNARSLAQFDLSLIPAGATIVSATINLYGSGPTGPGDATSIGNVGDNASYLQRVTSAWGEFTVTWNTQPTTTTTDEVVIGPSTAVSQDMSADVTQLVQDMIANPSTSYGFEIRLVTEDTTRNLSFWSREATDAALRPTLTVAYLLPCPTITVSISSTPDTCEMGVGSATVTVTGGVAPYTYAWSDVSGATTQTVTGLYGSTTTPFPQYYYVTVTDANGCSAMDSVTLTTIGAHFNVATGATQPTCDNSGAVQLNISGSGFGSGVTYQIDVDGQGSTNYSQNVSGFNPDNGTPLIFNGMPAGNYLVYAISSENCVATDTFTILASSPPAITPTVTDATCGLSNGSITTVVNGGTAPYSFVWSNGATSQNIDGLTAGNYTVTVTDANMCSSSESFFVGPTAQSNLTLYPTADNQVGFHDGFNTANTNGASATYFGTFMQPGSVTGKNGGRGLIYFDLTSLPAGAVINSATLNLKGRGPIGVGEAISVGNVGDNVSLLERITSPWDPATVTWNTQPTASSAGAVTVGPSTQTIQDMSVNVLSLVSTQLAMPDSAFGWELRLATWDTTRSLLFWSSDATDINNRPTLVLNVTTAAAVTPITITATATDATCGNNDGAIALTVDGGTAPYAYVWSNGDTTDNLTGIAAGSYVVTVTDANGCSGSASADVINTGSLLPSLSYPSALCSGSADICVDALFATYLWSTADTTQCITVTSEGFYDVTVTNANGCSGTAEALIAPGNTITITFDNADASCNNLGQSMATADGGIPPYYYNWSNGSTDSVATGLSEGLYYVSVFDANGCSAVDSTYIFNNSVPFGVTITTDSVRCDLSYVQLTADIIGGNGGAYAYSWTTGGTDQTIVTSGAGPYAVTATDASGCTAATDTMYLLPPAVVYTPISGDTIFCPSGTTTLSVDGGFPAYLWSNGATMSSVTVSSGGTYSVTVFTADGCDIGGGSIHVSQYDLPTLSTSVTNASSGNNGAVDLTVSGAGTPYTYSWNTGASTQDISGLAAGTYTVTVTTTNGCTLATSATVVGSTGCNLTVDVTSTNLTCYNSHNGSATANVSGATGAVTYNWSNGKHTQTINHLNAGMYSVTVSTADGCTATGSVSLTQPSQILAYTNCAHSCPQVCNGSSTITVISGGTAPYTYHWANGATTQTISNLCPSVYWATITDANGCTKIIAGVISASGVGPCGNARMDEDGNEAATMIVYPNPVDQMLNVSLPSATGMISVVNALGQTMQSATVTNQLMSMDVTNLAAGVYFVRFENAGAAQSMKFIKQ